MASIEDFNRDKKELFDMIDNLSNVCETGSDKVISRELLFLHQKVVDTNLTIERFLNKMSNIEKGPLSKMKDSLQELIIKLETSVCVPEFCVGKDIYSECQKLTGKLIKNLEEIMLCYSLTDMTRATNKKLRKTGINRSEIEYKSLAPNSNVISESLKRRKTLKCKKRPGRSTIQEIGRFSVTPVNFVGKKKKVIKTQKENYNRIKGKRSNKNKKKSKKVKGKK